MWETDSLWFEVAIVSTSIALGHIFLGHFEERTAWPRKLIKYIVAMALVLTLSVCFGRTVAMIVYGSFLIPILYIHGIALPRKGINGWTAKPKAKYYEFRGWDKDIFKED